MSNRPFSIKRVRLVPDLGDGELYGAWGMIPQGGLLVDHTPQANDGVPGTNSVVENTILGPMRRYGPNSGVIGSLMGAANAFALNDVTVSCWCRVDSGAGGTNQVFNYYESVNDAWGVVYALGGTAFRIFDDIDNAGTFRYSVVCPDSKLVHIAAVMDSLENLLYVDGVLGGSGESSSDDWSSFAGQLIHGERDGTSNWPMMGIVSPMLIYNAAKDQAWVTKEYLKGARAVQFRTSWGVRESVGNEVANMRVGMNSSPFEILSGTFQMQADTFLGHDAMKITCIGAGRVAVPTSYFEATPTEAAFGGYRWWHKKADASVLDVALISTDNVGNGYTFRHAADESCSLIEVGVGNVVAGGTATADAWHQFDVTRRFDGLFNCYVDRASFGTGTDLTVTTSSYFVFDMDAGDEVLYATRNTSYGIIKFLGCFAP